MTDAILQFFDFNTPCPKEIKNCSKLRQNFTTELTYLTAGMCTNCDYRRLKNLYIAIIKNNK